jgi:hypothetical protein
MNRRLIRVSDRCRECKTWWEKCPCCQESFCPDCGALESEQDEEADDDDDEE